MPLTLQREITKVKGIPHIGPIMAIGLQRIEDAINNLGVNVAADPTGTVDAPSPIQGLTIRASGGLVHMAISDNNQIQRGIEYFVEHDTNPAFMQPQVEHLGTSRQRMVTLPAKTDSGADQQFYFRAYSQYRGGLPSKPIHFGGTTPTPVSVGGTTQLTLIPSTGSGTAPNNGSRGGSGFGTVLKRG